MLIYFCEIAIHEGFDVLEQPKKRRLVNGRRASPCSGWPLFSGLRGRPIRCWTCGCEADRWILSGQIPYQPPVLKLYAVGVDQLVLMTRDHIIPKSLGGMDAVENLRPACEVCNGRRGNEVSPEDMRFRAEHPHLISQHRLDRGVMGARRALRRPNISPEEAAKLAAPFLQIDPDFDRFE